MVFMGAETGSDETLARMNKGGRQTTEQTIRLARRMAHFDIVPEMSFVLGIPPDPDRDVKNTMNFIRRVKAANPATEIILYLYSPVPLAGDLYSQARASGFKFPQTLDAWADADWVDFAQHRSADLPWLNDSVKQRISDFQRVLQATYPTVTDPLNRDPANDSFDRGDVLPWDWIDYPRVPSDPGFEFGSREEVLRRLAPNITVAGEFDVDVAGEPIPDFRAPVFRM